MDRTDSAAIPEEPGYFAGVNPFPLLYYSYFPGASPLNIARCIFQPAAVFFQRTRYLPLPRDRSLASNISYTPCSVTYSFVNPYSSTVVNSTFRMPVLYAAL